MNKDIELIQMNNHFLLRMLFCGDCMQDYNLKKYITVCFLIVH